MTPDEARAVVDAKDAVDRAYLNLSNLVRQAIHAANPEYPQHEARVAEAGETYAAAEAALQELLVGQMRGVPVVGVLGGEPTEEEPTSITPKRGKPKGAA